MFFTQEDYIKIQQWLVKNSVKDTKFNEATIPFNGNEIVSIVQGDQNKKVFLKDLVSQIFNLGVSDFVNITDKYGAPNISLEEAIRLIPSRARKEGQVITFLDRESHWHIYQFKGALNQWNVLDTWEDLFDWEKLIIDSILPDEEDLTKSEPDANGNSYLSLKDREYNPNDFSGLGRVILRKNIVEVEDPIYGKVKKNILYQDMFTQSNTIYEIRYDFDLNGVEITIPEGCILQFEGGSFNNGIVNGVGCKITSNSICFNNLILKGSFNTPFYSKWWFDESVEDIGEIINNIFHRYLKTSTALNEPSGYINNELFILNKGEYTVKTSINLSGVNVSLDGNESLLKVVGLKEDEFVLNTIDAVDGSVNYNQGFGGIYIKNLIIDGEQSECGGIRLYYSFRQDIINIRCINMSSTGMLIGKSCPETFCDRITLHRKTIFGLDKDIAGFYSATSDSNFNNIVTVHYPIGLWFQGGASNFIRNVHPWGYGEDKGYIPTMKIGIYLSATNTQLRDSVVDTYSSINHELSCEDLVDGQLNGGCGIFVKNVYGSYISNIIPVKGNTKQNCPTIFISNSWNNRYENIKCPSNIEAIQYGANATTKNTDTFINVFGATEQVTFFDALSKNTYNRIINIEQETNKDKTKTFNTTIKRNNVELFSFDITDDLKKGRLGFYLNDLINSENNVGLYLDNEKIYPWPIDKFSFGSISNPFAGFCGCSFYLKPQSKEDASFHEGVVIYEQNLKKLILYNGSKWVNIDGSDL